MRLESRPDGLKSDPASGVLLAARSRLVPDPNQPRKHFAAGELRDLRNSIDVVRDVGGGIAKTGFDMPFLCRWEPGTLDKTGEPTKKSMLIIEDGERRWRATDETYPWIPLVIKNDSSEEAWDVALRSSIQKKLLSPLEEGNAFAAKMQREGWGTYRAARHYGVSEGYLKNRIYLRDCPADVQEMVARHPDTMSHALAFRSAGEKLPAADRKELLEEINQGLSLVSLKEEIEDRISARELRQSTRRAPDTHTQQRQQQAETTGSAPVSREKLVKGASSRESVNEAVAAFKQLSASIDNAASWFRTIPAKDYESKVLPEIERLIMKLEAFKKVND